MLPEAAVRSLLYSRETVQVVERSYCARSIAGKFNRERAPVPLNKSTHFRERRTFAQQSITAGGHHRESRCSSQVADKATTTNEKNEKVKKSFTGTRAPRAAPSKVLQNACFQKRVVVFKNLFRGPKLRFSKSRFPVIVSLVGYACSPCVLKVHFGKFHTEARV